MEEDGTFSSIPYDSDNGHFQKESWPPVDHPQLSEQAIVWEEVEMNKVHSKEQPHALSPAEGLDDPEEAESQWGPIILPVYPMTCPSVALSFATVQWDMPAPSSETTYTSSQTPYPTVDNSLAELATSFTNSLSIHSVDIDTDFTSEDTQNDDGLEEQQSLNSTVEEKGSVSQPCDVLNTEEETKPTTQEDEDPVWTLPECIDTDDGLAGVSLADTEEEDGQSVTDEAVESAETLLITEEGNVDSEPGVERQNVVDSRLEEEQERPHILLTGQTDLEQEPRSATVKSLKTEEQHLGRVEAENYNGEDEETVAKIPCHEENKVPVSVVLNGPCEREPLGDCSNHIGLKPDQAIHSEEFQKLTEGWRSENIQMRENTDETVVEPLACEVVNRVSNSEQRAEVLQQPELWLLVEICQEEPEQNNQAEKPYCLEPPEQTKHCEETTEHSAELQDSDPMHLENTEQSEQFRPSNWVELLNQTQYSKEYSSESTEPEPLDQSRHTQQREQSEKEKQTEKSPQPENKEQSEQLEKEEQPQQPEKDKQTEQQLEKLESTEQPQQSEKEEQPEESEQPEKRELPEKLQQPEKDKQTEQQLEKEESTEQPQQSEKEEQPEESEQPEKDKQTEQQLEKEELTEQPQQSEKEEQPEESEQIEKRELPEKSQQPEKEESTEKSQQPEEEGQPEQSKQSEHIVLMQHTAVTGQPVQMEGSEQSDPFLQTSSPSPTPSIPPGLQAETRRTGETDQAENKSQSPDTEVTEYVARTEFTQQERQTENSPQNIQANCRKVAPMQTGVSNGGPPGTLANETVVDREKACCLAERLYRLDRIQHKDVVRHLDKDNDFSRAVGEEYLKFFDFTGQTLDNSLRSFLKVVLLIGETQERERVLQHFACRFHQCNPHSLSDAETVLTLTCALMLLNSDLHGKNVGKAMSTSDFVSNLNGMDEGQNFSKELLKNLYSSIKNEPLEWAVDEEELKSSMLLEDDAKEDAPVRCKSNPFQDVPHDSKATVFKQGFLQRKTHADIDGKRTPWGKRSWKTFHGVLRGMVLYLHKDEYTKEYHSTEEVVSVHHALAERAINYTKKPHVFRLQTADWRVFLFQASSRAEMSSWINRMNLVSALHSSPPFPAAVGSQRRFCRPILPASQSAQTLERQLQSHAGMLESFQNDLTFLSQNLPEGRRAKAKELEENRVREDYLQHEICRYEVYIRVLEAWKGLNMAADAVVGTKELTLFDKALCKDMGDEDEEVGLKKSHSSPSLDLEMAPPPLVKVKRNISERRTYRKTIIPRRHKIL